MSSLEHADIFGVLLSFLRESEGKGKSEEEECNTEIKR
jgi:hypothetical protein